METKHKYGRVVVAVVFLLIAVFVAALDKIFNFQFFALFITLIALVALLEISSVRDRIKGKTANWVAGVWIILIVLASLTVWVTESFVEHWVLALAAIMVSVVAQNILAYYIGGRLLPWSKKRAAWPHKILDFHHFRYSRRKTLGVAIVSSALAMAVSVAIFFSLPGWLPVALAILGAATAGVGDIFESHFKRLVGAKDSGEKLREGDNFIAKLERAIASHGGVLDRFDALFFAAALALPIVLIWVFVL